MTKTRSRFYHLLAACALAFTSLSIHSVTPCAAAELMNAGPLPAAGGLPAARTAARVAVSPAPAADRPTQVTLSGSGFQYQPNAPGGVYVFFGAVTDPAGGSWSPSRGGRSGETFVYASTAGSQLLVAFQGGSSAQAANAQIKPDGSWSTTMTIPGVTFQATSGNPHAGQQTSGRTIDCRQVQCGIITIGAHGMWNANNESFTPVDFSSGNQPAPLAPGAGQGATGAASPSQTPAPLPVLPSQEVSQTPVETSETLVEPATTPASGAVAAPAPATTSSQLHTIVYAVFATGVLALAAALLYLFRARRRGTSLNKEEKTHVID